MNNDPQLPAPRSLLPAAGSQPLPPDYQIMAPMEGEPAPHSPIQLQKLLRGLLRFWWIPVITFVLGLGAAAVTIKIADPVFLSRARLAETVKMRLPESSMFTEDIQSFIGTQTELLKSDRLRDLALERLHNMTNGVPVARGSDGEPLPIELSVAASAKSAVYTLEARSAHPAYTQAFLDALMGAYLEYKKEAVKMVSGESLNSITELVQRAQRDLSSEQAVLTAFQRSNNLATLQEEANVAGAYLARLKTQLSDFQLEAKLLAASTADLESTNASPGSPAPGLESTNSPATTARGSSAQPAEHQNASRELELLNAQREKLSKNLRPKHPKIVKLDTEIDRAKKLIEIYQRQSREQLAASRQNLQIRIDNLKTTISDYETKVVAANLIIAEGERLRMKVQREQGNVDRLSAMLENVDISRNIDQQTLSILENASLPKRTYSKEIGIAGLGTLGGLGLGLGIVLLIVLRDDRLTSPQEINLRLSEPVVGQVPDLHSFGNGNSTPALLQLDDDRHAYAESFRSLRSALLFMTPSAERPRTILITSAIPNEGKSTVAANLARTLAQGGSRVILIDGDMRKGTLHRILGLKREPGLSEILRQPETLDQVIQADKPLGFSFIGSGSVSRNTGDLLLGPDFDRLLAMLRDRFDYVLIDSSPVFAADDASTLAPKVDGTLFIVRSGFSGARLAREALDLLYQRQAKVLGVVFNRTNASSRSYYYYKYADYYPDAKTA